MSVPHDQMIDTLPPVAAGFKLRGVDYAWIATVLLTTVMAWLQYRTHMDGYEVAILAGSALGLGALGLWWKPFRSYSLVVGVLALAALWRYGAHIPGGEAIGAPALSAIQGKDFLLKYFVSSQSAIMWMSALVYFSTATYFFGLLRRSDYINRVAAFLAWSAAAFGMTGLLARWRESYLINADYGHIPVSNLYEVFILFAVLTTLIYLFYEGRYRSRNLGGFVMLVIAAAISFLLWYTFGRGAHEIQPLVPALQSWWMKIHVPANFVGYGAFAIAAMVGVAYLIKHQLGGDGPNDRLPKLELLDDLMYKSIALGFAFFTIATILGAMWAAEAWGGYWSWDPKETWALIVWLNYAAWLHMRLTKGWRGAGLAWWAVIGLLITSFAFLGVNMFLSGLHSYGTL
ncbi:MAG: c-type cytochrome biogenesis protein CcsB [Pseudomonadota bacterium]